MSKPRLYGEDKQERYTAQTVLVQVLDSILRLLHPFMPFITEEIWQAIPHEGETIMLAQWPVADEMQEFADEAAIMSLNMEAVRAVRNIRAEMNVAPGKKLDLIFATDNADGIKQGELYIKALCGAENVEYTAANAPAPEQAAVAHIRGVDIYLPLRGLIDLDKEIARLNKEIANMDKEIARLEGKLNNQGFIAKAPAAVVEGEKVKLTDYSEKRQSLLERVAELNKLA